MSSKTEYRRIKCDSCKKMKQIQMGFTSCPPCRTNDKIDPKKRALYLNGLNEKGFKAWEKA